MIQERLFTASVRSLTTRFSCITNICMRPRNHLIASIVGLTVACGPAGNRIYSKVACISTRKVTNPVVWGEPF